MTLRILRQFLLKHPVQHILIHGHKKIPDVQVHEMKPLVAVCASFADKFLHPLYRLMCPLAVTAGIRVVNKYPLVHRL